jgi:MYXO-CTERM domain-containing protein
MRLWMVVIILITATGAAAQADMRVLRGERVVRSGGTDRMTQTGESPFQLVYTIQSTGDADLILDSVEPIQIDDLRNCTVTILNEPDTTVPSLEQTSFRLQVSPIAATSFRFDVIIPNNVPEGDPYRFRFSGHTDIPPPRTRSDDGCSAVTGTGLPLAVLALLAAAAYTGRRRKQAC